MIGIVLISHDDFCVGMLHAAEMICGDLGGQIVTVGLAKDAPVETFDEALRRAVKTVDTGDGIVILADLAGGTPFNRAAPLAGTSVRLFEASILRFCWSFSARGRMERRIMLKCLHSVTPACASLFPQS